MSKPLSHFVLFILLLITSCGSADVNPTTYVTAGTLATEVISYTPSSFRFRLTFFVFNNIVGDYSSGSIIGDSIHIDNLSLQNNLKLSFKTISLRKVKTPSIGSFSTLVLHDLCYVYDGSYNSYHSSLVEERERATRQFFKKADHQSQVALAYFGESSTGQPLLSVEGDGFTQQPEVFDLSLAYWSNYYLIRPTSPILTSIDQMLEYTNQKASTPNKNLLIFSYGKDSSVGKTLEQVIAKARQYNIRCHVVLDDTKEFWPLVQLSQQTGGFCWNSRYYSGSDYPLLGSLLNPILKGSIDAYEAEVEVNFSQPIVGPGTWLGTQAIVTLQELVTSNAIKGQSPKHALSFYATVK